MPPVERSATPQPESFNKLRRSIVLGGAIAVLVTGIAVAVVAMGPYYSTLARLQETHQLSLVTSRSAALEEYVFRLKEIGKQIASRTRAREMLESLNRGEVSLLEYQQFSAPILSDALKSSQHVAGITRFDVERNPVLGVGTRLPPNLWTELISETKSLRIFGPIDIEDKPHLVIRTNIVNRSGEQVGIDLVLFSDERIQQIVIDPTGLTESTGLLFLDAPQGEPVTVLDTSEGISSSAQQNALGMFKGNLLRGLGTASSSFAERDGMFVACAMVSGTSWKLLLFIPTDVLYAPSRGQIGWVLAVIILLLALGTYGVTVLLRPLSGRVMLRAEELEEELTEKRASEARRRTVFEHSPIGIWEEDYSSAKRIIDGLRADGVTDFHTYFSEHPEVVRQMAESIRLIAANEAAVKIYEVTDLQAFHDVGVFAGNPDIWDDFYMREFSALAEGQTRVVVEGNVRTASKTPIRVRTVTHVPEESRDTWSLFVSTEENITERYAAEVALRESEERYGHIAEAMKFVPLEMDPQTLCFTYIGPQAVTHFGHPVRDWKQAGFWLGLVHPDDKQKVEDGCRSAIDHGRDRDLEYRIRTADGEYVWVRHFMRVGHQTEGGRWWGVLFDISEDKRAQLDKHSLETQLRQAQKMEAIGQLTGGVAHDFNNILANILGYTYLAEEHLSTQPDGKLSIYLDEVRRAGERARDLVAQMLAFSRGGGGEAKPMVMAPVVLEAVKLLQSTLPASVQVRTRLDPLVPVVLTDPVQLHQSVMNLCINARDAMQGNGNINIDVNLMDGIKATCASCGESFQGRYGAVSVSDTGPGISAEVRARMFEPFSLPKNMVRARGWGFR